MKTKNLVFPLLFLFFTACRSPEEKKQDPNPNKCNQYSCPVHPDKTSAREEPCPACGRPFVLADTAKKDTLKSPALKK